jgi:hypothetical protein
MKPVAMTLIAMAQEPSPRDARTHAIKNCVSGNPSTEGVSTSHGLGWHACEQRIARCQSRRPSPRT